MIHGIGIDSVEIARFAQYSDWSEQQLQQLFTVKEIAYCLAVPTKSAERFAARFAAKEAFYKALSSAEPTFSLSLRTCLPLIEIVHCPTGSPRIEADWQALGVSSTLKNGLVHLSITHTTHTATAIAIISN